MLTNEELARYADVLLWGLTTEKKENLKDMMWSS